MERFSNERNVGKKKKVKRPKKMQVRKGKIKVKGRKKCRK